MTKRDAYYLEHRSFNLNMEAYSLKEGTRNEYIRVP